MHFNLQDIKNISRQIKTNYPEVTICTTLPYTLSIKEQIELGKFLEYIGIDLIQTEGTINNKSVNTRTNLKLQKVNSTLLTTYNLSKLVNIPIIAASGISKSNAKSALLYGASGVGIKTAVSNQKGLSNKIKLIRSIKQSMQNAYSASKKE